MNNNQNRGRGGGGFFRRPTKAKATHNVFSARGQPQPGKLKNFCIIFNKGNTAKLEDNIIWVVHQPIGVTPGISGDSVIMSTISTYGQLMRNKMDPHGPILNQTMRAIAFNSLLKDESFNLKDFGLTLPLVGFTIPTGGDSPTLCAKRTEQDDWEAVAKLAAPIRADIIKDYKAGTQPENRPFLTGKLIIAVAKSNYGNEDTDFAGVNGKTLWNGSRKSKIAWTVIMTEVYSAMTSAINAHKDAIEKAARGGDLRLKTPFETCSGTSRTTKQVPVHGLSWSMGEDAIRNILMERMFYDRFENIEAVVPTLSFNSNE